MYWANLLHIYQPYFQKKEIIHNVVKESYDKILSILERRPDVKVTLNICASLTEQLVEYGYIHILERIGQLAEKGQIELVGSAKYHPILPFLPKKEVIRQIKLNENLNQKYFKDSWRPRPCGFFLPEMAYDKKTARIIKDLGYEWIVLDEIAYDGTFGHISFEKNYKVKDLFPHQGKKDLGVIFRNRGLSMTFFGTWLDSVDKFFKSIKDDIRSNDFVITAFDGESLGHHRKHLINIWAKILDQKQVKTITYSQYLEFLKDAPRVEVDPLASSWSTSIDDLKKDIPYPLWARPDSELHNLQRQLMNLGIKAVTMAEKSFQYKKARKLLDKALNSDQLWWASARPWWYPGIIITEKDQFLKIASLLQKTLPSHIMAQIRRVADKISHEIEVREKSGKYIVIENISDWQ